MKWRRWNSLGLVTVYQSSLAAPARLVPKQVKEKEGAVKNEEEEGVVKHEEANQKEGTEGINTGSDTVWSVKLIVSLSIHVL